MKSKEVVLILFRILYLLSFLVFSFYLWIYYPKFDNEYKGVIKDVKLIDYYSAGFRDDTTSVYMFNLDVEHGKTILLRCCNYYNWPIDTMMQYVGQMLTISTLDECMHVKHGTKSVFYPERVVRIQDENGFDLPKSFPCWTRGKVEYCLTTFVLYLIGFILCIWLVRKWIVRNIGMIFFVLVSFLIHVLIFGKS